MSSREIPDPGFPDDDGRADPVLRAAIREHAADPTGPGQPLGALVAARLLVPVVAVLGETEVGERGLAQEKSSDMAAVLMTGADGRRALLAFTGADSLTAWDATARPVPVTARTAARAALQEGAAAVVVDVAGPAAYVVTGRDLSALAAGWRLARVDGALTWVGPSADAEDPPDPDDSAGGGIIG